MKTHIFIAGNRIETPRGVIPGTTIYQLSSVNAGSHHLLLEIPDDRDVPLLQSDFIVIGGGERFSVSEGSPADENPALRKGLRPIMNEQKLEATQALRHAKLGFSGLAELDPNFEAGDGVFVELHDIPDVQIMPDMHLIVQNHDRFYTSPCGNVGLHRTLDEDIAHLRHSYPDIEVVNETARTFVILKQFSLAQHWNMPKTELLLQVPQGYPLAAMDMFWVSPGLRLANGQIPQNADLLEQYCDRQWQRFSWHYSGSTPWNPAVDGLASHLRFVRVRLNNPM